MPATRMCPVRGGLFARLAPRGRCFELFFGLPRVAPWAILVASLREAGWAAGVFGAREGVAGAEQAAEKGLG